MIDVEERFRSGLEDRGWERSVPPDAMRRIACEASRQRLRALPVVAAAGAVAAGAMFVGAGQLDRPSETNFGAGGVDPTPSACAGFVHPTDGVPVWPGELTAVIKAAAEFDQWRVTDSRSVVDCAPSGFQVGAAISLVPVDQGSEATLQLQRVIAEHVTQAELRTIAAAGLDAPDVQDGPYARGAETSLLATSGTTRRVAVWSAESGCVVTITQSAKSSDSQAFTASRMGDLAGALLTLTYRTRS